MAIPQHQVPEWEGASSSPQSKKGILSRPAFLSSFKSPQPAPKEAGSSETPEEGSTTPYKRRFSDSLPHWLACIGRSRKVFLGSIAALILLILILGLALGLTLNKGKNAHKNLPLPTDKGVFNGDLTYYSPGPGYGACGYENTSEDAICAVSHLVWDAVSTSSNPNNNPLCGKKIRITRFHPGEGRNNSVDVMVVDRCTGCKETDIDLSIKMFEILADEEQGRVVGTWAWLN